MIPCAWPQTDIRVWAGIIEAADHFLGCDSVGQHIAKAVGTTVTAVIGSTYPENISYPQDTSFDIIDLGEGKRTFSPIRLTLEDYQDMINDECMEMTQDDIKKVITSCRKRLGKPKEHQQEPQKVMTPSCCEPKGFGQ
jgi:ADP-heptose:LPS heptosyltransferase